MNRFAPNLRHMTALATATTLVCLMSGCSSLEEDKINYKSANKPLPSLEVPPDLTQIKRDSRYQIGSATSALAMTTGATPSNKTPESLTATNQSGNAQIERVGNQRLLRVELKADEAWGSLREFWKENGFNLILDQPDLGIMETDWAENRAKLPQDFIRKTVGKVLDSLYSTGERDKFRTRVERTDKGLEITITHRGLIEVFNGPLNSSTVWTVRPADAELEIEFLRRLMMKFGGQSLSNDANTAQSSKSTGGASVSGTAMDVTLTKIGNQPAIEIKDGFDRAWRRVGVAIDRTGFTVEDRDRGQGVFFVRYAPLGTQNKEPGFFAKIFSSEKATPTLAKYRIAVTSKGDVSTVVVLAADGLPETSDNAQKIIKLLADEIK